MQLIIQLIKTNLRVIVVGVESDWRRKSCHATEEVRMLFRRMFSEREGTTCLPNGRFDITFEGHYCLMVTFHSGLHNLDTIEMNVRYIETVKFAVSSRCMSYN